MNIEFFKIPEANKDYEYQIKQMQDSCVKTGLSTNDEFWKNKIFEYLFQYYNFSITNKRNLSSKLENEIKKDIFDWLNQQIDFCSSLSINLEPRSEGTEQEGYDDIKFQSNFWYKGKKYFVFECKCLNNSKTSIREYIHRQKSKKNKDAYEDGGLYRFITNKYAANQGFGGLIGFVQQGDIEKIIESIKKAIKDLKLTNYDNKYFGQLIDEDLLNQTINENRNTFNSNHVRWDKDTNTIILPIHIYHIFFGFT